MKFDPTFEERVEPLHYQPRVEFLGGLLEGSRLLDVGCWTGGFEALAVDLAAEVTGMDVEPRALEVAVRSVP
ncbi:MAG: hypothetical protein V2A71_07035, partial [Candidatus Eisenbacteria bacterium]